MIKNLFDTGAILYSIVIIADKDNTSKNILDKTNPSYTNHIK